ncbi:MAG TPA: GNAT family protein [Fimbriimonadaceae bacterium]|nr:GNAT family protein [Fimbriimonadaceae bacterium]
MPDQRWVVPTVLEGTWVRLEPLVNSHAEGLAEVADRELFRFFAGFYPKGADASSGEEYIRNVNGQADKVAFAIVDRATDRPVGATSFMDIRESDKGLEIGSTWLAQAVHGSAVNPESKLLLLTHAFEVLGAIRVQFRTDVRNLRSRRAIEKLGAVPEGVFRQHTIMPDGFVRDSIFYSILPSEWPAVKRGLLSRLASVGEEPS